MTTTPQDNQTQNTEVSADQVGDFLRSYPHFFEQHASLLADIFLPSPHGNGAISLAERQQLAQRDKIRVLELKLAELCEFAEENDATSKKVHNLSVKLMSNQSFSTLLQQIADSLQQDFAVTQSLIRIWLKPSNSAITQDTVFTPVPETLSDWAMSLTAPYCGPKPEVTGDLLGSNLQSFAIIPLSKNTVGPHPFGVLILGAEDQQRFKAGMGTMYLERIGELIGTALLNHLFTLHL